MKKVRAGRARIFLSKGEGRRTKESQGGKKKGVFEEKKEGSRALGDWTIRGNSVSKAGLLPRAGCVVTFTITIITISISRDADLL